MCQLACPEYRIPTAQELKHALFDFLFDAKFSESKFAEVNCAEQLPDSSSAGLISLCSVGLWGLQCGLMFPMALQGGMCHSPHLFCVASWVDRVFRILLPPALVIDCILHKHYWQHAQRKTLVGVFGNVEELIGWCVCFHQTSAVSTLLSSHCCQQAAVSLSLNCVHKPLGIKNCSSQGV